MASNLSQAIRTVRGTYKYLRKTAKRDYRPSRVRRPEDDWPAYVTEIEQRHWRRLGQIATKNLARSERSGRELLAAHRGLAPHFEVNARVAPIVEAHFVPPRSRPDWPQRRAEFARELRRRGKSRQQIARAIARLEGLHADTFLRDHRSALANRTNDLTEFAQRCFAAAMGAHLARAVAAFNAAASGQRPKAPSPGSFVTTTLKAIDRAERAFYSDLRRGRLPALSAQSARQVGERLRQAAACAGLLARSRATDNSAEQGRLALQVGDVIRALLRHVALRYDLAWIAAADRRSPAVTPWLRAAAELPFDTAWQPPRRVSLARLSAKPRSIAEGAAITLEGQLGPVQIRHVAKVPISTAPLRDAAGHEVHVTAKHRKFDSSGMVENAWVEVSGSWEHRAPEAGGAALRLGRRRLTELAEKSWSDWVTARLQRIYEPSPEALMVRWSWQPGRDGAGNPLRYRVWFAPERRVHR